MQHFSGGWLASRASRFFRPVAFLILFLTPGFAVEPPIEHLSGVYGNIRAAVDDKAQMTAVIEEKAGPCRLFLAGKMVGHRVEMKAWDFSTEEDKTINPAKGVMVFELVKNAANMKIQIPTIHDVGGCASALPEWTAETSYKRQRSIPAVRFAVIGVPRSYFYDAKKEKQSASLVRGDFVEITEVNDGWVKAKYGKTTGYLRELDLFRPVD